MTSTSKTWTCRFERHRRAPRACSTCSASTPAWQTPSHPPCAEAGTAPVEEVSVAEVEANMSEQESQGQRHDAGVNRYLDGLDDRLDQLAEAIDKRRSRAARPSRWEYMTWRISSGLGNADALVQSSDGEEFGSKERPSLYEALSRAGDDGWELVAVTDSQGMIFKRPKAGG